MSRDLSRPEGLLLAMGAALVATLLGIGLASSEVIRHIVQASPVAALTLVAWRWPAVARWALAPAFGFWLFIATCIGLFLAHLPSPVSGTFNPAERTLTAALAVVAVTGFSPFPRIRRPLAWPVGCGVAALGLALQIGGFAISLQPAIAHR